MFLDTYNKYVYMRNSTIDKKGLMSIYHVVEASHRGLLHLFTLNLRRWYQPALSLTAEVAIFSNNHEVIFNKKMTPP